MDRRIRRRFAAVAFGCSALLVLAACGSSSKATVTPAAQPSASSTTPTGPSTTTAAAQPEVMTTTSASLGSVLVDAKGMTLYTLTNGGAPVPCTGQCASFWPPLLLPAGTTKAVGAKGVAGLGTVSVAGALQVTDNGDPLYRFSLDKAPGDTKGEGISSFGGVWHVVSAAAKTTPATIAPAAVAPTTVSPAMTSPSTMGGRYGY